MTTSQATVLQATVIGGQNLEVAERGHCRIVVDEDRGESHRSEAAEAGPTFDSRPTGRRTR